jgi:two-component system, response regulator PdtaR
VQGLDRHDQSSFASAAATVLVVEDDFLVRLCAADALSEAGFNVLQAASGPDALRILEDGPVDVVFTDINMPGAFDGAGLARRIRHRWPETAVVITSGRGCPEEDVGEARFLPKPYMPDMLAQLMEEVLGVMPGTTRPPRFAAWRARAMQGLGRLPAQAWSLRHRAGGTPTVFLKARLKAASDS